MLRANTSDQHNADSLLMWTFP